MVEQVDRDAAESFYEGPCTRGLLETILSSHRIAAEARGVEWKEQHENLLAVRQQDIAALQSKIESLEAQLKFKNEAINLTKGCPGKVVVRDGFYVLDCYKKKHPRAALNGGQHE